ncbi:MAG: DUF2341 domain-containing protein, partial [Promethearchaeota archaeon]
MIKNQKFVKSDHFFASLLRGLGYEQRDPLNYNHIPTLTNEGLSSRAQDRAAISNINFRISDYFTPGWADTRWQYRKNITINNLKVIADLTNFPIYIEIFDSSLQKNAQASGNDIMFSDATGSILDHEIELYERVYNSSHAYLVAWVKANISSTQDTILSMYYGNPAVKNQENPTGVWKEYVGVWHLTEASGNAKDSTTFDTDGVATSMNYQQAGVLGYGMEWNSSSSGLNMGNPADDHLDFGIGDFTISLWVRVDQDIGWEWILSKGAQYSSDIGYGLISDNTPVSNWRAIARDPTLVEASPSDFALGEWNYIVCKLDRGTDLLYIYGNGTEDDTTDASGLGNIDNSKSLRLPMSTSYYFDGWIDELRLTNFSRSAAWIQTEYNNQQDPTSFYTIESVEEKPREIVGPSEVPWYNKNWLYRNKLTINQTNVGINPYYKEISITTGSSSLPSGYSVSVTFNHAGLVSSGKSRADGNDIRVKYNTSTEIIELNRMLDPSSSWNNGSTKIWFQTQTAISASSSNNDYLLYYGNILADSPLSNSSNIFFFYDGFESGNLSSWDGFSEGSAGDSISASTDQAYTGTYSAKCVLDDVATPTARVSDDFPDELNLYARVPIYLDPSLSITDRLTVMQFVDTSSGWQNIISVTIDQDMTLYMWNAVVGEAYGYQVGNTISTGTWHTLEAQAKISDTAGEVRLWLDDSLEIEATGINLSTEGIDKFAAGIYWAGDNEANTLYVDDIFLRLGVDTEPTIGLGTEITQNLTNFPLLINDISINWKNTSNGGHVGQVDGGDILFTSSDGITKLDHEIEKYEPATGELIAWVNVPTISLGLDTDIFIYYGNATVTDQWNVTGTWVSDYLGVWHLKDSPSGVIDEIKDSTSNLNDGYTVGSMSSNDLVNSKIGLGLELDGTNDMIIVNESASLDSINDEGTLSLWINWVNSSDGEYQRIMVSSNTFPDRTDGLEWTVQPDGDVFFYPWEGNANIYNLATDPFTNDQWHHLVVTLQYSTKDVVLFLDGTILSLSIENVPLQWTQLASIDDWLWGGHNYYPDSYFTGLFDEIRVSDVVRSSDWIITEYNNQYDPNSFYSVGSCEYYSWWADVSFSSRKDITIDNTKVSGDLTDFPVLLQLYDSELHNPDKVQADGDDILFTNASGYKLDHEIEHFNQTFNSTHAFLVAWVKVQSLSNIVDTNITMYFGNPTINSQANPEGVWQNDYIGVWHLNEDGDGTTGEFKDSTSNNNDGTGGGSSGINPPAFPPSQITGQIGNGLEFDESTQEHIEISTSESLESPSDSITIVGWVNSYIGGLDGSIVFSNWGYGLNFLNGEILVHLNGTTNNITSWVWWPTGVYTSLGWHQYAITYDGSFERLFIDGTQVAIAECTGTIAIGDPNPNTLRIGSNPTWGTPGATGYIEGKIDEVRISTINKSADWISTEYNNQFNNQDFFSVGITEEYDLNPPVINDYGVDDLGTGIGKFWANIRDSSGVTQARISINGSNYEMSNNGTYWIHQMAVNYSQNYVYQIVNASDNNENYLTSSSSEKDHTFNFDTNYPDVLDWEYVQANNTFQANVTDTWGEIDTVRVNVTTYSMVATMVYYNTFSGTILAYMNDTLSLPNGPMDFLIIVNDTAGNEYTSSTHSGTTFSNNPPVAENLTLTPATLWSNTSLTLSYDYYDADSHPEDGTEIRWYKYNGTAFKLQTD